MLHLIHFKRVRMCRSCREGFDEGSAVLSYVDLWNFQNAKICEIEPSNTGMQQNGTTDTCAHLRPRYESRPVAWAYVLGLVQPCAVRQTWHSRHCTSWFGHTVTINTKEWESTCLEHIKIHYNYYMTHCFTRSQIASASRWSSVSPAWTT